MEAPRRNDMGTAKKGDGGIPRYARNDNVKAGAFMVALRRNDMGTAKKGDGGIPRYARNDNVKAGHEDKKLTRRMRSGRTK